MNFLKRCAVALLGLSFIVGFSAPTVRASDLLLGGQKHEYKVVLRNDGRAIVIGKMTIPNFSTQTLANIDVGLSVGDASQMSAYQLIVEQSCSKFEGVNETRICTKYKDVANKDVENAAYEKITIVETAGQKYTLSLPRPVAPGMTAVVLFAYSSLQYTQENLGLFSYSFSTPTVDERIDSVSITVQTDSDLVLQGKGTTMHYNTSLPVMMSESSIVSADSAMTMMTSNRGNIVRENASDLFPGESYTVTGEYSEFWWRFLVGRALIAVGVLALIIGLGVWKRRKMGKGGMGALIKKNMIPSTSTNALGGGLLTAVLIIAWTAVVTGIMESTFVRHLNNSIAEILMVLVIAMVFLLIGFGPAVAVGEKKGVKTGITTFVAAIAWLVIGIAVVSFFVGSAPFLEF